MFWHIVTFDMAAVAPAERAAFEALLKGLAEMDEVVWLHVAPDVDEPTHTGLITVFASYADLEAYRAHPLHQPVVERLRMLDIPTARLDIQAPFPPPSSA